MFMLFAHRYLNQTKVSGKIYKIRLYECLSIVIYDQQQCDVVYFVHRTGNVKGIPYRHRLLVSCSSHFIRSDIRVSDTCLPQKILDFLFTCMRLQGYQRYNDP